MNGRTPLLLLGPHLRHPPAKRVRLLLSYGADPMAQVDGRSAIHNYLGGRQLGDVGGTKVLVRHGVDVNAPTTEGETPLMLFAAIRGHEDIMEFLLRNGADATLANVHGQTALHYAQSTRAIECLLDHGAGIDAKDSVGRTPLMTAARWGTAEAVNSLLAYGADLETTCLSGTTALHYAVASRDSSKCSSLLGYNIFVDVIDGHQKTPLFDACTNGDVHTAGVLLQSGADIYKECNGSSPFDKSICAGQGRVLQLFLEHGARVDVVAVNGHKPLFHAARHDHIVVVRLLLAHGADKNEVDKNGETAADIALQHGHDSLAQLLRKAI